MIRFKHLTVKLVRPALAIMVTGTVFLLGMPTAFGAFTSDSNRVLGVGRIQSTATIQTTDSSERLVLPTPTTAPATISSSDLTVPIEREVVVNVPVPLAVSTALNNNANTPYASASSSGLSDDEMLAWIITRESHGNIYSTNGIYVGIGQLNINNYPNYIGMTYEETLASEDPYGLQLQAMLVYINQRYSYNNGLSPINNAYNFWKAHNWY
ncbi:MAG: hypothetical protein FWC59_00055 [Actinomycetia bacterium]|nr:hypothetical protein [Actinomycetes bacterium]